MSQKISVNSQSKLSEAISAMTAMFNEKKYVVVTLRPGKDRTLDQNALWFALYQRISVSTQIGEAEDARAYCKLHMGVQILLGDDADFNAAWQRTMKHLSYEEKLSLMGNHPLFGPDGFPVTRLFNRAQGVAYTEAIVANFSAKGVFFGDLLGEPV
ncbi:NimB-like recombination protein [Pseudomonas phage AH02]|nr:NimB-like recombination protein [Pseudomonas phage AH02]